MIFRDLNLEQNLIENLESLGYKTLTPIQENSLKYSLEKKDIIARAKTGSGKTLAFCLPIINNLDKKKYRVQSLILAPTRELATQIATTLREVLRSTQNIKVLTLCGGVPYRPQVVSLEHEAHIIVGTAGRVLKHINEGNLKLENINTFVLDEADKMLDMGFFDDISNVCSLLPKQRQTLLFSATFSNEIKNLALEFLNNPVNIEVEDEEQNIIKQVFYEVNSRDAKDNLIEKLIKKYQANSTIIFCNQRVTCEELADSLYERDIDALTLHSDLDQKQRDETLTIFSNKSYPVLIASDVASRGIDINDIDLVINYDLALNYKIHTHRIGRTARAGKGGVATTFVLPNESKNSLEIKEHFPDIIFEDEKEIVFDNSFEIDSTFRSIFINGGKKQKLRKGDILGALTAGIGLAKEDIGTIDLFDFCSYVAIKKEKLPFVLEKLQNTKIKGKFYRAYEK